MNNDLLYINNICQELGIGKNTAYRLIKNKELKSCKLGSHIVVHCSELQRYIKEKTQS